MLPEPGQVIHFSEDPSITVFRPHVAATAQQAEPYVWALDAENAPCYWFPRNCPRVAAWPAGAAGPRVHAIEYGWLERMRRVELYAYRFAASQFRPFEEHAMVSTDEVRPLGPPEAVGDLFAAHDNAGIELRVRADLWPFLDDVVAGGLRFSAIRMRNARPRP